MRANSVGVRGLMTGCRMGLDGQPTMHDACMQLGRLGQTDGEPDSDDPGQGFGIPVPTHASNIEDEALTPQYPNGEGIEARARGCLQTRQGKGFGWARAIFPSAPMSCG